ncbi:MAG TPA: tetratricopeptide repeat protein [Gaiellaceae bacterium]
MEGSAALLALPPVTPAFVAAAPVRGETSAALVRAESLVEQSRYEEAVETLGDVEVPAVSAPDLALRVLHCEAWARMYLGQLDAADALCERARALAEGAAFSNDDRAEAIFRLAACRLKRGKTANAVALFTEAIRLGGDRVRARAFEWRARCFALIRDWDAAMTDAEHALEYAELLRDARLRALAKMQCSVIAERRGDPRLARYYAEQARDLARECGDRQTEARLLNNLGGLSFLLGRPEVAVAEIKDSFALFLELGCDVDAAQAVSSLAQVHLRCGAPMLAEEQARHALSILDERDDFIDERGNAHLVLGRALLEQGRKDEAMTELAAAEWLFERLGSKSHVAAAWVAQGDAYARLGDTEAAAALYRRAAEALQDFNF